MKYKNKKTTVNGMTFDSKKEANRYIVLSALERKGVIYDLKTQVPFELLPALKDNGKVIERAVIYKADFTYWKDGEYIVEDTKGVKTRDYIIKRKLMLYKHGIRIKEV